MCVFRGVRGVRVGWEEKKRWGERGVGWGGARGRVRVGGVGGTPKRPTPAHAQPNRNARTQSAGDGKSQQTQPPTHTVAVATHSFASATSSSAPASASVELSCCTSARPGSAGEAARAAASTLASVQSVMRAGEAGFAGPGTHVRLHSSNHCQQAAKPGRRHRDIHAYPPLPNCSCSCSSSLCSGAGLTVEPPLRHS